jgi:NAD(P) transhydrogenase
MSSRPYDLAVIGSGPAGQKGAIAAAKQGKHVAVADRFPMLGGACLHTGTVPSKTVREAALYLSGFRQRPFYGRDYTLKAEIRIEDLATRVAEVMAHFRGPHTVCVETDDETVTLEADHVLVACGTRPTRPGDVPFEKRRVIDSDDIIQSVAGELPKSAIVVGAGVIGLEYASIAATLGIKVTVIETRESLLSYVDAEITEALTYHLRQNGVIFRLGEKVQSISTDENGPVVARLHSGKTVSADRLLYAVGRRPNTDRLKLEAAGLSTNERGRLEVNENFQTEVPHIYAAGDVIGFPSLASTSMEQGRLASCHMFGIPFRHVPELLPYGIYTIPEIAMVGRNEHQLTEEKLDYEVGLARFEEVAKAQIIGDRVGLLKLIFNSDSLELLGVHVIGDGAAELLHIGQSVMSAGGTIETLRDTVFNYPTLAEVYKVAAIHGLNRLQGRR